ncbi:unnamed protein product [Schistocephalus solidus]|uniref:Uncharacterized protein n=1 Tax=Schistocephalus solidus TaxID=70667 RepID=A0A183SEW2_SCHSO|nr:unnamed protein product [Schistocephalus solidus]
MREFPLRGIRTRCGGTPRAASAAPADCALLRLRSSRLCDGTGLSWYPTLTCGSSKLVLSSGHTPGNYHDRRAKPDDGLRFCVSPHPVRLLPSPSLPSYLSSSFLLSFTLTSPSRQLSLLPDGRKGPMSRAKCKHILANQCLEHQHTAEIAASTALTVLAHSPIAWAFSVKCASMTAEFTTMPTTPIPYAHPPLLPFLPPLQPLPP